MTWVLFVTQVAFASAAQSSNSQSRESLALMASQDALRVLRSHHQVIEITAFQQLVDPNGTYFITYPDGPGVATAEFEIDRQGQYVEPVSKPLVGDFEAPELVEAVSNSSSRDSEPGNNDSIPLSARTPTASTKSHELLFLVLLIFCLIAGLICLCTVGWAFRSPSKSIDKREEHARCGNNSSLMPEAKSGPRTSLPDMPTTFAAAHRPAGVLWPDVLYVAPNKRLAGVGKDTKEVVFRIVDGEMPNGKPLWKLEDGQYWFFCGSGKQWFIGDENERRVGFQSNSGHIVSIENHAGRYPDEIGRDGWMYFSGAKWERDTEINVTSPHFTVDSQKEAVEEAASAAIKIQARFRGNRARDRERRECHVRGILAAAGGSFVEWYDAAMYSYLTEYLKDNFFAGHGGTLAMWAGFAITFMVRPLGGALFGMVADTVGRKLAMQLTIAIMLTTTIAQGCLPTFHCCGEEWGWIGLVSLLALRFLQGLSVGGELSTAAVYITEVSPVKVLGFNLSMISVSGSFGAWAVAGLVVYVFQIVIPDDDMLSWGWRLPYLTTIIPGAAIIFGRQFLKETKEFEKLSGATVIGFSPIQELFKKHLLALLVGSLGTAGIGAMWFVFPVYGVNFVKEYDGLPSTVASFAQFVTFLFPTLLAPAFGMLVDTIGVGKCYTFAILLGSIIAPIPMFYWWAHIKKSEAIVAACVGQCIIGLLNVLTTSVYLWVVELFPVEVRATGASISYNIGIGIFGGLGPLISDYGNKLIPRTDVVSAPAAWVIFSGLLSMSAIAASWILASHNMMRLTYIRASPY